jgi:hypothetical protein
MDAYWEVKKGLWDWASGEGRLHTLGKARERAGTVSKSTG